MSFNIRYDTPRDGRNRWSRRRASAVSVVHAFSPDVLGLQEVLPRQLEDWRRALPGYHAVSFGRDGGGKGEAVALFIRSERLEVVKTGGFWLSETPDAPSRGWDASLPRVAVWAQVKGPKTGVTFLCTHFDHVGARARVASATLLKAWLLEHAPASVILMGDFNARPGGPAHRALEAQGAPELSDTYRSLHQDEPGGTFHNWGDMFVDARMDWIFASKDLAVLEVGIDRSRPSGQWPSDHFPVTAVLSAHES